MAARAADLVPLVHGVPVPLTAREFEVFLVLARAGDRVVTRQTIYRFSCSAVIAGYSVIVQNRTVDASTRSRSS